MTTNCNVRVRFRSPDAACRGRRRGVSLASGVTMGAIMIFCTHLFKLELSPPPAVGIRGQATAE